MIRRLGRLPFVLSLALPFILPGLGALGWAQSVEAPAEVSTADAAGESSEEHEVIEQALQPVLADLDLILERRLLRVAIPYTPIYFAYDGDKLIGFAVEMARELEAHLRKTQKRRVDVLLIPLPRDQIIPAVVEGRVDLAMANLTITEARQAQVAFADPIFREVSELVVTGRAGAEISSFDDLARLGVFLRPSSSYYAHLTALNATREAAGEMPVPITEVEGHLEDYDLLDMLEGDVIPATIVDSHKLELWEEVFEHIVVHRDLAVNRGGEIAWAMRKDAPKLLEAVNGFISTAKQGTLLGNIMLNRYFRSADWIEEIRRGDALEEREEIIAYIQKYAAEYDFDWRLIFAQAYRESRLDQAQVSDAGAVGVMQVLPSTASDPNVAISDISEVERNIEAGVKYLDFIRDRYFATEEIAAHDRIFLSLAAYNAGPGGIAAARARAEKMGLDPNVWFANVEIATAKTIGAEPVTYVRSIYKNFISFGLLSAREDARDISAGDPEGRGISGIVFIILAALAGLALVMVMRRRVWQG